MTRTHTTIDSPFGELTLVAAGGVLSGLYFPGHWYMPDARSSGLGPSAASSGPKRQLGEYFAGERTEFDLPTTADRRRVPAAGLGADRPHPLRRRPPPTGRSRGELGDDRPWPARSAAPSVATRSR